APRRRRGPRRPARPRQRTGGRSYGPPPPAAPPCATPRRPARPATPLVPQPPRPPGTTLRPPRRMTWRDRTTDLTRPPGTTRQVVPSLATGWSPSSWQKPAHNGPMITAGDTRGPVLGRTGARWLARGAVTARMVVHTPRGAEDGVSVGCWWHNE